MVAIEKVDTIFSLSSQRIIIIKLKAVDKNCVNYSINDIESPFDLMRENREKKKQSPSILMVLHSLTSILHLFTLVLIQQKEKKTQLEFVWQFNGFAVDSLATRSNEMEMGQMVGYLRKSNFHLTMYVGRVQASNCYRKVHFNSN